MFKDSFRLQKKQIKNDFNWYKATCETDNIFWIELIA